MCMQYRYPRRPERVSGPLGAAVTGGYEPNYVGAGN